MSLSQHKEQIMKPARKHQGEVDSSFAPDRGKSPRSFRRVAMDCLARREHSFFELKQKLQTKFPHKDPLEIQRELERLREENLQSDKRFVESFVRHRKSRGFGMLSIRESLRSKFVAESLIEQHLFADDDDWKRILDSLIERRLNGHSVLAFGGKQHLRMVRFLLARGFSQLEIRHALNPFLTS
jgi:regulatory protein